MAHNKVSRGDCEAVFHTAGTGGQMIILHDKVAEDPPPPDPNSLTAAIRVAGPGSPWDGAHFCEDDWHVILRGDVEGGDESFTEQDAKQIIEGLQFAFTLDGNPLLQIERTAMEPFLNPESRGFQNAWWFQQGQFFEPNSPSLSVGSHQVDVTLSGPTGVIYQQGITFFIDAPGTGACI
jgi:hypothetical protein